MKKRKNVLLSLSEDLYWKIRKEAEKKNIGIATLVKIILSEWLFSLEEKEKGGKE